MTKQKFTNDYDIITYAFVLLIPIFKKEDNIFVAQCIWWLASVIQYTGILQLYFDYQKFPSEYVRDCIVTPLPWLDDSGATIPDSNIPALDLHYNTDIEEQLSEEELPIESRINKGNNLNTTRSRRVFKNKPNYKDPTILELEQQFGRQSKKQRRRTSDRLRAEHKDMWRIILKQIMQET